jgi:AmmeMemoRadiSam system protein A
MSICPPTLSQPERTFLLELARQSIALSAQTGEAPTTREQDITPALRATRACFVTLTKHNALRGCIGNLLPQEPLFQSVIANAQGAAFRDSRFPPVVPGELSELEIEISVLGEPKAMEAHNPEELVRLLKPGIDGVILRSDGRTVTFLPQVWDTITKPEDFLWALSRKAGLAGDTWCDPETHLMTYQVESFATAHAV